MNRSNMLHYHQTKQNQQDMNLQLFQSPIFLVYHHVVFKLKKFNIYSVSQSNNIEMVPTNQIANNNNNSNNNNFNNVNTNNDVDERQMVAEFFGEEFAG
jgi:hypothetical protein